MSRDPTVRLISLAGLIVAVLGHRQPVVVPQDQRRTLRRIEPRHHLCRTAGLHGMVPGDVDQVAGDRSQLALLAALAPPVIDQLVPGNPDQPGDRPALHQTLAPAGVDRPQHRLRSEVLSQRHIANPAQQVVVDLRYGVIDEGDERPLFDHRSFLHRSHIPYVASGVQSLSTHAAIFSGPTQRRFTAAGMTTRRDDAVVDLAASPPPENPLPPPAARYHGPAEQDRRGPGGQRSGQGPTAPAFYCT